MGRSDVDIVRRAFALTFAPGEPDMPAILRLYHADHELITDWGIEGAHYYGEAGFREAMAIMEGALGEWTQALDELIDAGDGVVLVLGRLVAEGRHSGAPVEGEWAVVVTLRDGKIASTRWYTDRGAAFAATGVERG
jgi:ketosteroid isomerase-like protein